LNQINPKENQQKKKETMGLIGNSENVPKKTFVVAESYLKNCLYERYLKSIKEVAEKIDSSDAIFNYLSIKELFHRYGLNMRFSWIVLSFLKTSR
jgi:hypothetical protein